MNGLRRVKSILEFNEKDREQGVERNYIYYNTESAQTHTSKQEVDIISSPYWKKMLFLDGTLQSTIMDEVIYHNALVHPLMDVLQNKEKILILGGGEGATAREVLRWTSVKGVVMVDYDKEFVDFIKIHGSEWSMGAFHDPRLSIQYQDAWLYMKLGIQYNGIIIDLTDPDLKTEHWSELLMNVIDSVKLNKGGFVMNAGHYQPWNTMKIRKLVQIVKNICIANSDFKYYIYTVFVPSFNGEWTFIVVAHKRKFMIEPEFSDVIPAWIKRGIKMLPDSILEEYIVTIPDISPISVI
jgi:spermidine synthase